MTRLLCEDTHERFDDCGHCLDCKQCTECGECLVCEDHRPCNEGDDESQG
jgi:hypothetical protein